MKLSVCIDALFRDTDVVKAMETVKRSGIDTIEFWSWWNKDLDKIIQAKKTLGMYVGAFCTKFTSLVDESTRSKYVKELRESIQIAKRLNCHTIITQVGNEITGIPRVIQHNNLVNGLKACVPILEEANITLVVEPLNTLLDHKGYYLYSSKEAFQIIDEVGSRHVKVLYDIYHQQIMEGNLISAITQNIEKIGHFHAAGNPGRHELHIGEINYKSIIDAINHTAYNDYLGLEYFPLESPEEGLVKLMDMIM